MLVPLLMSIPALLVSPGCIHDQMSTPRVEMLKGDEFLRVSVKRVANDISSICP